MNFIQTIKSKLYIKETNDIFLNLNIYSSYSSSCDSRSYSLCSNNNNELENKQLLNEFSYKKLKILNKNIKNLIIKKKKLTKNMSLVSKNYMKAIISTHYEKNIADYLSIIYNLELNDDKSLNINSNNNKIYKLNTYNFYYIYNKYLRLVLNITFFVLFIILSLIIFIAEITLFLFKINLNPIGLFLKLKFDYLVLSCIFILIPLIYLVICTVYALFKLKINYYEICKKNTDNVTALFFVGALCIVSFPICLNFIQILKLNKKTQLESILGEIGNIPLIGSEYQKYYPIILFILSLFTIFNYYQKIANYFGLQTYEGCNKEDKELFVYEGHRVLEKYFEKLKINEIKKKDSKNKTNDSNNCNIIDNYKVDFNNLKDANQNVSYLDVNNKDSFIDKLKFNNTGNLDINFCGFKSERISRSNTKETNNKIKNNKEFSKNIINNTESLL